MPAYFKTLLRGEKKPTVASINREQDKLWDEIRKHDKEDSEADIRRIRRCLDSPYYVDFTGKGRKYWEDHMSWLEKNEKPLHPKFQGSLIRLELALKYKSGEKVSAA